MIEFYFFYKRNIKEAIIDFFLMLSTTAKTHTHICTLTHMFILTHTWTHNYFTLRLLTPFFLYMCLICYEIQLLINQGHGSSFQFGSNMKMTPVLPKIIKNQFTYLYRYHTASIYYWTVIWKCYSFFSVFCLKMAAIDYG